MGRNVPLFKHKVIVIAAKLYQKDRAGESKGILFNKERIEMRKSKANTEEDNVSFLAEQIKERAQREEENSRKQFEIKKK